MSPETRMGSRVHLLGSPLDVVDMEEATARCRAAIESREYLQHMSVNAAKLVAMRHDVELRESVGACGLVTADGQSVVWAARLLGVHLPERVAGIDLMQRLLVAADKHGYRVYFLGARAEVLETAIARLQDRLPGLEVAGAQNGYFADHETEAVAEAIRRARADILFVAMSSPRKEHFLGRLGPELGAPFTMGVGGSVDILAGLTKRAPAFLQKAGLEWAYRLAQEPRRLGKRYLATNFQFIGMVGKELVARATAPDVAASAEPADEPGRKATTDRAG